MDEEQARRLGWWLREQRKRAGLSTIQLARRAETTDATIVRLEQGVFVSPAPDKLSRIAKVLNLSLADVYSMAGYAVPQDLPSFQPYLRRKYGDLPAGAIDELDKAFGEIIAKHGYDLHGPRPGEDEAPDPETLFD
jgi:transcriptional regulator with XRE-family HTH domain